jgi:hypothetical protein
MTPKEKAKELVEQYYQSYDHNDVYGDYTNGPKEAALIAIDEMINYLQRKWDTVGSNEYMWDRDYYIEVKQEINNL